MSSEPPKRSRFDQVEPNIRRQSRFDRRSRSRSPQKVERKQTRSPLPDPNNATPQSKSDPAAAAAAAAAKINAQLQTRIASNPPEQKSTSMIKPPNKTVTVSHEVYTQDGDFMKDIEINDLKNRYTLTKGATQKMIKEQTGADVTTRGEYCPGKGLATSAKPPLYLHVTSTTKEGLDRAIELINELIKIELPVLVDERRLRRNEEEQERQQRPPSEHQQSPSRETDRQVQAPGPAPGQESRPFNASYDRGDDRSRRRGWLEAQVPIDLEPIPGFNLRAQVVGQGGAYVKHIQQETRCKIQIKGRGSGFVDRATGLEADEPMFLHIMGHEDEAIAAAKELCIDLLENVRKNYEAFKERGPSQGFGNRRRFDRDGQNSADPRENREFRDFRDNRDQRDNRIGRDNRGGIDRYNGHDSQRGPDSFQGGPAQSAGSPTTSAQGAGEYGAEYDPSAAAAYAQQYPPGQDPYAAYGGYQNYVAMYYAYYGQQTAGGEAQPENSGEVPPPPPGDDNPPPPPPSGPHPDDGAPPPPPPPGM